MLTAVFVGKGRQAVPLASIHPMKTESALWRAFGRTSTHGLGFIVPQEEERLPNPCEEEASTKTLPRKLGCVSVLCCLLAACVKHISSCYSLAELSRLDNSPSSSGGLKMGYVSATF